MATANDRLNAMEGNLNAMMETMAQLAAGMMGGGNTPIGVNVVNDDDDTVSDTPAVNTGKSQKATAKGWRATAEVMPESVKRERQQRDPNSRCSLEQATYAAGIVSQYGGLAKRVTDGIVWYQGVKRVIPEDAKAQKAEAAKRAQYDAHMDAATAAMLAAFNVYAEDAEFDTDSATYGDLWEWLSTHAPVSLQKAKREHDAEAKRNGN
jgi:hypothetical protein